MRALKLRKVGSSMGLVLPKEMLGHLLCQGGPRSFRH